VNRVKIIFPALAVICLVACQPAGKHQFNPLGSVTRVAVSGTDGTKPFKSISDSKKVAEIVSFVDARRTGWGTPWTGVPVPVVTAEIYKGQEFEGSFGVGENFFSVQRDGGFFTKLASSSETHEFLDLLGVDDATYETLKK
jgi:hypothetical protein